ncbi:MAG: hypothetical protein IT305_03465 [Chloroflexi bacterium]|nr:hypothetical protein [Chloroflexota bacterium]
MKATIELPDDLYRQVEARSAREGRPIHDVAVELFRRWLAEDTIVTDETVRRSAEQWLERWLQHGKAAFKDAPPGPSAREILQADRDRLERR